MEYDIKLKLEDILDGVNLAEDLPEDFLKHMGSEVARMYDVDLESRSVWEDRMEEAMKLALQISENKNFPWEGAANVKYPLLTIAAIQFAARAGPQLLPGDRLVSAKVTGKDPDGSKMKRADRISRFMSYQLSEEMEDWIEDMDRMLITLPIMGSIFKKTYADSSSEVPVSELVYVWDLVFDYWAKSPEKAARKTHRLYLTNNEIIERIRAGIFLDQDLKNESAIELERTLASDAEGMEPGSNDPSSPREILEMHCWWDLDGDDYEEPYIVTIDKLTRKVLRVVARFEADSVTFDREGQIMKITPTEYFTQYIFIPDPNGGSLGLGFGYLLGPINETINTLLNQLLDNGTLTNMQSGFLGSGLRLRAGDVRFSPGEWKIVRATGADIKNNVVPLPVSEPSQVLFSLLQMLIQTGERLSTVTDAMAGDNPPTNQPASTTLAMIEQGLKVFTAIYKRIYRSMREEFRKIYDVNRNLISMDKYMAVLDDPDLMPQPAQQPGQPGQMQQTMGEETPSAEAELMTDFSLDRNDVQPAADPNLATEQQKLVKGQALMQLTQIGGNPKAALAYNVEILDVPDQFKQMLMEPPPPPPPDPKIELEKVKIQGEMQKAQFDAQIKQSELNAGLQKMQQEMKLKEEEHRLNLEVLRLELEKIRAEIQKINTDANAKMAVARASIQTKTAQRSSS